MKKQKEVKYEKVIKWKKGAEDSGLPIFFSSMFIMPFFIWVTFLQILNPHYIIGMFFGIFITLYIIFWDKWLSHREKYWRIK